MNYLWSTKLQGLLTLDVSRELRFRDDRKELILYILGLKRGMNILEIGCGTGALARKLATWLGDETKIVGIDRDTNFINYAKEIAYKNEFKNISFFEGDALELPFTSNSFDSCLSHTVIEHVPNKEFLLEQKRVCKQGGRISVMITLGNKTIVSNPDDNLKQSEREKELMKPIDHYLKEANDKYIKNYWSGLDGLPRLFDELEFKDIQVDSISLPVVIDDSRNNKEIKIMMIEDFYKNNYDEAVEMGQAMMKDKLSDSHIEELRELINKRFNGRMKYLEENKKLWDYKISTTLVYSGAK